MEHKATPEPVKSRADFAQRFHEAARSVDLKGIPVNMALAVAALETGWGTGSVFLRSGSLFNIKATNWNGPSLAVRNEEGLVYFRSYPTWAESLLDWVKLITTLKRYTKAHLLAKAGDYKGFFNALQEAGYAGGDKLYSAKLEKTISALA